MKDLLYVVLGTIIAGALIAAAIVYAPVYERESEMRDCKARFAKQIPHAPDADLWLICLDVLGRRP